MKHLVRIIGLFLSLNANAAAPLDIIYDAMGQNNQPSSFDIIAMIGDPNIARVRNLYAEVEYAELSKSAELNIMPKQKVSVGQWPVSNAPFIEVRVDRLKETTMYRARINLYKSDASSYIKLYTTPFYYTTTTGPDPKSLIRTRMILRGLKEFSDSERGYVGANGTMSKDGTRYGADPGELWCSEFYAWVADSFLKGIKGAASVKKIKAYFSKHSGLWGNSTADFEKARRGDYLSMDTDLNGDANHSGMFLALDRDDEGLFVWTLEGNSGNKIRVHRRPYDRVFVDIGHIMHSMYR